MFSALLAKADPSPFLDFQLVKEFPGQGDLMTWCQQMGPGTAILVAALGAVYLLYGWSMFKPLVILNAAIIGGYIGAVIGNRLEAPLAGGILGALTAASITYPLLKWAVAVMGGICGALVGASIWRSFGLESQFAWAGAMTGLVGFGLFSFILFRGSIIMYTSLQGAIMLIIGVLGLAFKYQEFEPRISSSMNTQPMMLPIAVLVPTILGLIYQQTHSSGGASGGGVPAGGGEKKK
jgi:hypothetical protein